MILILAAAVLASSARATPLPELEAAPFAHSVAVVGGKVYVVGGYTPAGRETRACRVYDGKSWARCPDALRARASSAATELDGKLWVAGGLDPRLDPAVDVFDPATKKWRRETTLPLPVHNAAAHAVGGKLYVLGGEDAGRAYSNRVDVYDPVTKRWSSAAPMRRARKAFASAMIGGKIYVAGGSAGSLLSAAEVYDPATNRWTPLPSIPTRRHTTVYGSDGRRLYVAMGGSDGGNSVDLEAFDPAQGRWSTLASAPVARDSISGAFWRGCLLAVGGRDVHPGQADQVLAYDPRKDEWTSDDCAESLPLVKIPRRKTRPDDFALVVGVEKYRTLPSADYAERDAALVAEHLKGLGVPEENVVLLTGERAAKGDLEKYLEEWLPKNLSKESRLYVYFSGHGAPEPSDGTTFLVPWDGDAAFLRSTAYPVRKLLERLATLPAKEIIVALDACFSGAGGRSVIAKGLRPLVQVGDATKGAEGRLIVFTASAADQVSGSDDQAQHGLFTHYFSRGLSGEADGDKDGRLTVAELDAFVRKNVARAARRQNREQTTQLRAKDASLRLY